jgi:hypothetical protein
MPDQPSTPTTPQHPKDPKDSRVWVRYSNPPSNACQTGVDERGWSAQIQDISRGGLNLLVNRSFEPGSLLKVEVPSSDNVVPSTLIARVIRAVSKPDNKWALGCAFVKEISEADLKIFLQSLS